MKIYRFIPNGKDFRFIRMPDAVTGVIGPRGILLRGSEFSAEDFSVPLSDADVSLRGVVETYETHPLYANRPLSDFPPLYLNVPIVSERAVSILRRIDRCPDVLVPVSVDGFRFFAIDVASEIVCDPDRSEWVAFPPPCDDEPAFCYRRAFEISRVRGEFFGLGYWYGVSDCYITSIFVDEARRAGLTGLEYIELVYDEQGPVIPTYPVIERIERADRCKLFMERGNLSERWWTVGKVDFQPVCEGLIKRGLISLEYTQPTYKRSLE